MDNKLIVDVRERDEFQAEHVAGAINLPLSELKTFGPNLLKHLGDKDIVLMCLSGNRARMAQEQISQFDFQVPKLSIYEGGIKKWKQAGQPTVGNQTGTIPVFRQVMVVAGLLVITFFSLGSFISPVWYWGTAAIGAGLFFGGASGICMMANLLKHMPWNKA